MTARGGARPGAGRKRRTISDKQIKALLKAFQQKAREQGRQVWDLLADVAFDLTCYTHVDRAGNETVRVSQTTGDRLRAIELYAHLVISRHAEIHETHEITGPWIGLPPIKRPEEETYPQVSTVVH